MCINNDDIHETIMFVVLNSALTRDGNDVNHAMLGDVIKQKI